MSSSQLSKSISVVVKDRDAADSSAVGWVRRNADLRQMGGLMLILGMVSVVAPLPKIATLIGPNGTTTPTQGLPLSGLIGSLCLCVIGMLAVFGGYAQLVHDYNHKALTQFMILFTQTAFIPYVTDMTAIGKGASSGANAFGFEAYENHTPTDVRFVGAMGILGVLCYGFTYVGSISFMQFCQYAYISGKPEERSAPYYRGRQYVYCFALTLAGLSQFLLGAYLRNNYGGGALPSPIGVAVYQVNFPGIAILMGIMQMFLGIWGFARAMDLGVFGERDVSYQLAMFMAWLTQLALQVIVQMSYPEGGAMAPMLAMIACMSVGLNLMPAYLDYKGRSVPENIIHAGLYSPNPINGGGGGEDVVLHGSTAPLEVEEVSKGGFTATNNEEEPEQDDDSSGDLMEITV